MRAGAHAHGTPLSPPRLNLTIKLVCAGTSNHAGRPSPTPWYSARSADRSAASAHPCACPYASPTRCSRTPGRGDTNASSASSFSSRPDLCADAMCTPTSTQLAVAQTAGSGGAAPPPPPPALARARARLPG
eukprot:TRINITY_DN430_c0_g1_i12.p2 TRINITY_DN430_c0_g1~~TRINITY_DN430_c0_g1_i12.p2  ORF type:complete len:132 (+),score=8.17 TRINITY_DN430_c0_g1_i12:34-429(+)